MKTMFSSSLPPVVCRKVYVLFTLFVFVCSSGVFALFDFVLYTLHCMLQVSVDCPFLIVHSVFSNVYLVLRVLPKCIVHVPKWIYYY